MDEIVTGGGGPPLYGYTGEPDRAGYVKSNASAHVMLQHVVRPEIEPGANPYHYVIIHVNGENIRLEVEGVDWGKGFAPYRSNAASLSDPRQ